MTNLQLLLTLNNQQGGTIHDLAKFYGVAASTILNHDTSKLSSMIDNLASNVLAGHMCSKTLKLAKEYYNKKEVTLTEVTNMVLKYHFMKEQGL